MKKLLLQEKKYVYFQVRLIGCGGNGGYLFRNLLQMISTYGTDEGNQMYDVLLADGDVVEKGNLKNQLYDHDDVGLHKAISLIERYSAHYGVPVKRVTEYITSTDMLRRMFPPVDNGRQVIPVLIGAVDNDRSRQLMDDYFYSDEVHDLIWIDLGIEAMTVFENPTAEQKRIMEESGFGGQCVVGVKWKGSVVLEPVTRVYTNILENDLTAFPGESCGELLPNYPQRLTTNQTAAQVGTMVLNNLFHTKIVYTHVTNFNTQFAQMKSTYLTDEQVKRFENAKKGSVAE
ncbi:hypothetical protein J2T17_007136 [Paenibacillus mucilaginosus]|uniref:ThiF family adenylyltransferase n=1 Tax=Paenibacillus mucilaginosus TaxID=61624 RepID=UPI003D20CB08